MGKDRIAFRDIWWRWELLVRKRTDIPDLKRFMQEAEMLILKTDLSDAETLTQLRELYLRMVRKPEATKAAGVKEETETTDGGSSSSSSTKKPSEKAKGRSSSRIRDIQAFLDEVKEDNQGKGPVEYLDVGCSEGQITEAVAEYMDLGPKTAYGVDVVDQSSGPAWTFKLTNGTTLDFPDSTFGLETMFMSMHHFQKPTEMFAESRRVARAGATLIVREHNMSQPYLALWFDLAHSACILSSSMPRKHRKNSPKSMPPGLMHTIIARGEWEEMLADAGWKLLAYVETGRQGQGDSMNAYYASFIAV